jgi:hypothetical protein
MNHTGADPLGQEVRSGQERQRSTLDLANSQLGDMRLEDVVGRDKTVINTFFGGMQAAVQRSMELPRPPERLYRASNGRTSRLLGREVPLAELDAWARSPDPLILIDAVGGMGGMGKSALLWHWLEERAEALLQPAGVVWWSFDGGLANRSLELFARTALAYITETDPELLKDRADGALLDQLCDQLSARPYLIVLDGFEYLLDEQGRAGAFGEQLLARLPLLRQSKVALTSRRLPRALLGGRRQGLRRLRLGGLRQEEAQTLCFEHGVRQDRAVRLDDFLDAIDCCPLLIRIVAGQVASFARARGDFDAWYEANTDTLALLAPDDPEQYRAHLLQHAFAGLDERQLRLLVAVDRPMGERQLERVNPYLPPLPDPPQLGPLAWQATPEPALLYRAEARRTGAPPPLPESPPLLELPIDETAAQARARERAREAWTRRRRFLAAAQAAPPVPAERALAPVTGDDWLRQATAALAAHGRSELGALYRQRRGLMGAYFAYRSSPAFEEARERFWHAVGDLQERGLIILDEQSASYSVSAPVRSYALELLGPSDGANQLVVAGGDEPLPAFPATVETLAELESDLLIYDGLLRSRRWDDAAQWFEGRLAAPLRQLGRLSKIRELVAPFFPRPVRGLSTNERLTICDFLAYVQLYLDEPEAALPLYEQNFAQAAPEYRASWLAGVAQALLHANRIAAAQEALRIAEEHSYSDLHRWMVAAELAIACGDRAAAEQAISGGLRLAGEQLNYLQAALLLIQRVALNAWLGHELEPALSQALELLRVERRPVYEEQLLRLWAADLLRRGDLAGAAEQIARAAEIAKQAGIDRAINQVLEAQIALARGQRRPAERFLERLPGLKVPPGARAEVHLRAAELALELDQEERAGKLALEAHRAAWADGPGACRRPLLVRAEELLADLGLPRPAYPEREREGYTPIWTGEPASDAPRPAPATVIAGVSFLKIGTIATFGVEDGGLIIRLAERLNSVGSSQGVLVVSRYGEEVPLPETYDVEILQRPFAELAIDPAMARIFGQVFAIVFISSYDRAGEPCFAYVNVRLDRLGALLNRLAQGVPFNLAAYTTLIVCRSGTPTAADRLMLQRDYLFGERHVNVRIFPPLNTVMDPAQSLPTAPRLETELAVEAQASPPAQPPFLITGLSWLQIGTLAAFGLDESPLVHRMAAEVNSMHALPLPIVASRYGEEAPLPAETWEVPLDQPWAIDLDLEHDPNLVFTLWRMFAIVFISSRTPQGEPCYAYVNVRLDRFGALVEKLRSGEPFDLAAQATIVTSGTGLPTAEERQRLYQECLFSEYALNLRFFPPLSEVQGQ